MVSVLCGGSRKRCARPSTPFAASADGILMILLPFPFDSSGRSLTGNISMRPAAVIASSMSLSFSMISGGMTCALSGRLISALPARLRDTRSLKVQIKP